MPQSRAQGSRPRKDSSADRDAVAIVHDVFKQAGWSVSRETFGDDEAEYVVAAKSTQKYLIAMASVPKGTSTPLANYWSSACLRAVHYARITRAGTPMAVVCVASSVSEPAAMRLLQFAAAYSPDVAVGVMDHAGFRAFRGTALEELQAMPARWSRQRPTRAPESHNLFSDLNQWMLKVLLAPELPQPLLSAPRSRYRNASELARAANVSAMSASRLVRQLDGEGYLDESGPYLNLVRRQDLFRRWEAAARRQVREMPMRFLLRGDPETALSRMLRDADRACLGLFAAADALHLGFVQGVPPHVYVQQLDPASAAAWRSAVRIERGEAPDFILRQALAPQSIFRGLVKVDDVPVSDVLQIWLDVSSNPSRGEEQADLIRQRILGPVIDGSHASG